MSIEGLRHHRPEFFEDEARAETIRKISDLEALPRYEEVYRLIEYLKILEDEKLDNNTYYNWSHNNSGPRDFHTLCSYLWTCLVPTAEFIEAFAGELKTLPEVQNGPILEIAAGNGKLSYHLQRKGVDIHPTDRHQVTPSVELIDMGSALRKYNPFVVVSSWLDDARLAASPMKHPSVQIHIDIGEGSSGSDLWGWQSSSWIYNPRQTSFYIGPHTLLGQSSRFAIGWTDSCNIDYKGRGKNRRRVVGERISRTAVHMFSKPL